ncbi:MAG: galactose mutarotase [Prevotellaceae bacterium]|jgi:aldose 1-epimerase|nr:galactose mutarotase [Prevotellaceae bacterium]
MLRLTNSSGAYVEALSYGATLVSVVVPDRYGRLENVVLGYPSVQDYLADDCYLGSAVGRFANRISGAKFTLNGQTFFLDKNDGENSNHGGFAGFSKKMFSYRASKSRVIFSAHSADGEGGFPGNVSVEVAYSFSDSNELLIEYRLTSDKDTVINLTNHAYFNLCPRAKNIFGHELLVNADKYLEFDEYFLPTGNILPVAHSDFDFSCYRNIEQMMRRKREPHIRGYNAYFVGKRASENGLRRLASLRENVSGRLLEVYATAPGVQLYTGDYLHGEHQPFAGLCLEAQGYPDAPNHPHFPSCVVAANQEYRQEIRYRFGVTPS